MTPAEPLRRVEYEQSITVVGGPGRLLVSSGPSDDYLELILPGNQSGSTEMMVRIEALSGATGGQRFDVRVATGEPPTVSVLVNYADALRMTRPYPERVREVMDALAGAAPDLCFGTSTLPSPLAAQAAGSQAGGRRPKEPGRVFLGAARLLTDECGYLALRVRVHIALHTVEEVLRQNPSNSKAWQMREDLVLLERRERRRQREPGSSQAQFEVGFSYLSLGCDDDAISALTQAVRLDPSLYLGHVILGIAHHHLCQFEQARVCYERAGRLRPGDKTPPDLLTCLDKGDPPPIPVEDRPGVRERMRGVPASMPMGSAG
jgi:hypothetical protein